MPKTPAARPLPARPSIAAQSPPNFEAIVARHGGNAGAVAGATREYEAAMAAHRAAQLHRLEEMAAMSPPQEPIRMGGAEVVYRSPPETPAMIATTK